MLLSNSAWQIGRCTKTGLLIEVGSLSMCIDLTHPTNSRHSPCRCCRCSPAVRYLGIEVDDALEIAEQTEI